MTARFAIFDGATLIGHSELNLLDPPMGYAIGAFIPTPGYSADAHANVFDGEYVGDRGVGLRVVSASHGEIEHESVSIQDYPSLDEIQIAVGGIPYPLYEQLFGDQADYRTYWRKG